MNEQNVTEQLETIISLMSQNRDKYSSFIDEYLKKERTASLAVASGQFDLLTNEQARKFAKLIPKPTVAEKEWIVEMELGTIAHQKAVIDAEMKILEKQAKTFATFATAKNFTRIKSE